ncbi:MAG: NAD(P)/FAD-dependent oxidoreductase [Blastocatellia bacterium]|nr:NAD(P)/FAD-dependent oxidoreductase [Blastocatellia bacterium]
MSKEGDKPRPRVLIVGGGFGGLTTAQSLKNASVDITLVDRTNHHLFQPLLYQVAMAGLSPADIASPIRSILHRQKNTKVVLGEVTQIDFKSKMVSLRDGENLSYDYLVLAVGAKTSYFGHDEWSTYAPGLKSLEDAIEIRRRVLTAFEKAEREENETERRRLLTFVVIGGGPTGVELAGALSELSRFILSKDFKNLSPTLTKVILLEKSSRVLSSFTEDLSEKAIRQLDSLGVEVRTGASITKIDEKGVVLEDMVISSATVLWGAGVAANPLAKKLGLEVDWAGRVVVEPDLTIAGYPEVFAIGDMAAFLHQNGKPLPGIAPVAMQQAQAVARAITDTSSNRTRKPFHYIDKGSMATIGRSAAIFQFGRVHLSGFIAWVMWMVVHILFLIGFRNRIMVSLNWLWQYFTYQRGARLITGERFIDE